MEFVTRDGRRFSDHVVKVRGAMENPMSTEEVAAKARQLLRVALPDDRAERVIETVLMLDRLPDVSDLTRLVNPM